MGNTPRATTTAQDMDCGHRSMPHGLHVPAPRPTATAPPWMRKVHKEQEADGQRGRQDRPQPPRGHQDLRDPTEGQEQPSQQGVQVTSGHSQTQCRDQAAGARHAGRRRRSAVREARAGRARPEDGARQRRTPRPRQDRRETGRLAQRRTRTRRWPKVLSRPLDSRGGDRGVRLRAAVEREQRRRGRHGLPVLGAQAAQGSAGSTLGTWPGGTAGARELRGTGQLTSNWKDQRSRGGVRGMRGRTEAEARQDQ